MEETKIDFDKLAVSIIEAYESDREESGRSELAKGMEYVLDKYKSELMDMETENTKEEK